MRTLKRGIRKEDNSPNMGVDDIEDVMEARPDSSYPTSGRRDYDDISRLVPLEKAEKILGERPDGSYPKPPTSKHPRADTIKKYQDAVASYPARVKALKEWEKKYDRLAALAQLLKNTQDELDDLREDLAQWASMNNGTYVVMHGSDSYSWVADPSSLVDGIIDKYHVPDEIGSLDDRADWVFNTIAFDEDSDIFPSALITLDRDVVRIIAVPDDIAYITSIIEDYVDTLQPKDILSETNAKMDQKSSIILQKWRNNNTTNSQLDENEKQLKLFLASSAFLKEIQQLNKYPNTSQVGRLVSHFLKQI